MPHKRNDVILAYDSRFAERSWRLGPGYAVLVGMNSLGSIAALSLFVARDIGMVILAVFVAGLQIMLAGSTACFYLDRNWSRMPWAPKWILITLICPLPAGCILAAFLFHP